MAAKLRRSGGGLDAAGELSVGVWMGVMVVPEGLSQPIVVWEAADNSAVPCIQREIAVVTSVVKYL